jgi:hypothetical protein
MSAVASHGKEVVGAGTAGLLAVGRELPDFELLDDAANRRRLSHLVGADHSRLVAHWGI